MSRKNWGRFFPPSMADTAAAPKKGPGLWRWLLASTFVCLMTGAVVVVKVRQPDESTMSPSDPAATAEKSDYFDAPTPTELPAEPQPCPAPVVEAAPTPVRVVPAPTPLTPVSDVPTHPAAPTAPETAAPAPADVAPSARLMPPEQPRTVEAMTVSHRLTPADDAPADQKPAPADARSYLSFTVKQEHETLWKLARQTLGSAERWVEIARLNPEVNSQLPLAVGEVLRLPADAHLPEEALAPVTAVSAATSIALAASGALVALPLPSVAADTCPPPVEPQRVTLVDAQPAPAAAPAPQALHNEGSAVPAAAAPSPEPTPPAPQPVVPQTVVTPPSAPALPAQPQAAPPTPPANPLSPMPLANPPAPSTPSAPLVPQAPAAPATLPPSSSQPPQAPALPNPPPAVASDAAPPPAVAAVPPQTDNQRTPPLPLPELIPVAPKTQVEAPAPTLPITGTYHCDVVNGTSVKLPARLQQQTDKTAVLYVGLGPDQQSVWIYTPAALERLNEQLERLPGGDDKVRRCRRLCFSRMEAVEINHVLGCMVLPTELAQSAGLHDKAVLIGARDHYELWDAQRWQQYTEPAPVVVPVQTHALPASPQ